MRRADFLKVHHRFLQQQFSEKAVAAAAVQPAGQKGTTYSRQVIASLFFVLLHVVRFVKNFKWTTALFDLVRLWKLVRREVDKFLDYRDELMEEIFDLTPLEIWELGQLIRSNILRLYQAVKE